MSQQTIVILDNPPLESDPWAARVFADAQLVAVDNDAVTTAMSKDEAARKALLAHSEDPMGAAEQLAAHYLRILEQLHGGQQRLGMYGTAWLVYVQASACVIDWSEVETRATAQGVPEADGEYFRQQSKAFVHARIAEHLPAGRLLELDPGLSMSVRVAQTLDFLRGLGVV